MFSLETGTIRNCHCHKLLSHQKQQVQKSYGEYYQINLSVFVRSNLNKFVDPNVVLYVLFFYVSATERQTSCRQFCTFPLDSVDMSYNIIEIFAADNCDR